MKTLKTLALVAATVLLASCSCGQKECKFNAKKYAECKTEKLDQIVDLDDAQEKAVYAVYLKEGKAIASKIKECKKAECTKPCEKKCDKPACDKKAECNKACDKKAECTKPCDKKCDKPACDKKCDKPACDKKVGCKKQACKATCEEIGAILTPAQKEALKANCKPCKKAECEKPCAKKEECAKPCEKKCDKPACDKKAECNKPCEKKAECTKPCNKKAECNK
ncbi:MAG: hypothetical protein IIV29_02115 [Tidjanibacter sp.]|nr:hypothetical protein [Tidjanibacter sp.]